LRLWPISL